MGFDLGDKITGPNPNAIRNKVRLVTYQPVLNR